MSSWKIKEKKTEKVSPSLVSTLRKPRGYRNGHFEGVPKVVLDCLLECLPVDDRKIQKPTSLAPPKRSGGDEGEEKKDLVMNPMRGLLGSQKTYQFRLGVALDMSSTGTGIINSVIGANSVSGTTEFSSFATIFDEFFVLSYTCAWRPYGKYVTGPLGTGVGSTATPNTNVSSRPFGSCDLHHGQSAYTSLSAMSNNARFHYRQSDEEFSHTWKNVEDPHSTVVVVSSTSSSTPSQGWCLTAASPSAQYQGQVQFLSQSAPPALPLSQVLGTFIVRYNVLFRCRQ